MQLDDRCKALLAELKLGDPSDVRDVVPLTGGVASDIAMVDLGDRKVCVKFALPKLKVAADWQAPVHRNAAEYAWLRVAADVFPESAVQLFGRSETQHGFAMEFLDGDDVYLWKDNLLAGAADQGEAERVADLLGRIHATSAAADFDRMPFQNRDDFHALRVEPYLSFTRAAHPDLTDEIQPLEDMLYAGAQALVHGDASPKNILFRDGAPILLDAECATMGDASFDPAFCLNHLILKAIHLRRRRNHLFQAIGRFWGAYARHVNWEERDALEARISALLPVLMLARVDGKSPVEYLSDTEQQRVRDIAIPLISAPVPRLRILVDRVARHLTKDKT